VVNIHACFLIERLSFEITRPAAFLCGRHYKPYTESILDKPWSLTLTKKRKAIEVPGLGNSKEESYKIMSEEYEAKFMDLTDLDFGDPGREIGAEGVRSTAKAALSLAANLFCILE
jgi:hypothetical protein